MTQQGRRMSQIMGAGKLDKRFAFDKPVSVSDGAGGQENGWQEEFKRWGHKVNLRGSEPVLAARLESRQPVVLTIRACDDTRAIDGTWRARETAQGDQNSDFPGTVFNIRTVIESDDRKYIEITAESGVAT